MYQLVYVITATLSLILAAVQLLMVIRAVTSWFPIDEDNAFMRFVYFVTEPVIMPVRAILDHFGLFEGFPIDMSFFITFMLLSVLSMFL